MRKSNLVIFVLISTIVFLFLKWTHVISGDFNKNHTSWFDGAKINVSYNCLDQHLETCAEKTALTWKGDSISNSQHFSHRKLHESVCRFANALKNRGVKIR